MSAPPPSGAWTLEPADNPALAAALRPLLSDPVLALRGGTLLRSMGDRLTGRVALPGLGDVLVKAERLVTLDDRLRGLVQPTRARLEWRAARHLRDAGVPVPAPHAVAEQRRGRRVVGTLYVATWLPDRQTLAERLERDGREGIAPLLPQLGRALARMHAAGFDHRDLHAGNVLVGPGPTGGLNLIDLHRGRLGAAPGPRAVGAALARLLVSLRLADPEAHGLRRALLTGYLGEGVQAAALAEQERALRPLLARFERRHLAKHDRYALRVGPFFGSAGALGLGVLRRSLAVDEAARALTGHDLALAAHDERVLKDQRKSAVTRHGYVVVKELRVRGGRGWAKRLLAPGRLAAGHVNAHRLEVRGYATARPLGFLRRAGRVFTLYENLSAFPRLDHHVRSLWPGGAREQRDALRDACADLLARLHAQGVYHGDFKAVNLLVGGTPAEPRLVLVDTDRCRFGRRPVSPGRRVRNLAQLAASIPLVVSRSERLRWWRRYAQACGLRDDERGVARAVAALVAEKTRVVDAPIE